MKFLFRQQTTRVVLCRMAQTQFIDSLLPGNPVFIAVTLYLDYLLFRYFQYAFHLGDSFRFGAKVRKGFRLCYTCWAGRMPMDNLAFGCNVPTIRAVWGLAPVRVRSCWANTKKSRPSCDDRVFEERQLPTLPPGGAVPSAMAGLTSLFGMGRGGSPPL